MTIYILFWKLFLNLNFIYHIAKRIVEQLLLFIIYLLKKSAIVPTWCTQSINNALQMTRPSIDTFLNYVVGKSRLHKTELLLLELLATNYLRSLIHVGHCRVANEISESRGLEMFYEIECLSKLYVRYHLRLLKDKYQTLFLLNLFIIWCFGFLWKLWNFARITALHHNVFRLSVLLSIHSARWRHVKKKINSAQILKLNCPLALRNITTIFKEMLYFLL